MGEEIGVARVEAGMGTVTGDPIASPERSLGLGE